jgi:nucleotide-binding universal stress UspA family protein
MATFATVLVTTDFSGPSIAALTYGRDMARTFGATLQVLHVTDDVMAAVGADLWGAKYPELQAEVEDTARTRLEAILTDDDRQKLQAKAVVRTGSAAAVIVDYAKAENIDLIVIGTHGRSGLPRMLIGSVAERVVRLAPCPVLTVRRQESRATTE